MVVSKIYDYLDNENLFILISMLNKYLDISIYLDNHTPLLQTGATLLKFKLFLTI